MGAEGASCPISGKQVDLRAARTNGVLVFATLAAALALPEALWWLVLVLAADFAAKVSLGAAKSPLSVLASAINRSLGLRPRSGDAAPKRFAALLGLAFNLAAAASWLAGFPAGFYAFAGMCCVCAAMEGFLDFCMGCWAYGLLHRRGHAG